jgi:hypothetical protein
MNGNVKKDVDANVKNKSSAELFEYKYKLIYHHKNMLTIKEWLNKRILAIEENAK